MNDHRSGFRRGFVYHDRLGRWPVHHYFLVHDFLMHHRTVDNRSGRNMAVHVVDKAHMVAAAEAYTHDRGQ